MKLTSITFTGIDEHTDLEHVEQISQCYPYVEWGVLLSYHHKENGNRYPDPHILEHLDTLKNVRLAAHICGGMAKDVVAAETKRMHEHLGYNFDMFSRCQINLNVSARYAEMRSMRPFDRCLDEVIMQMIGKDALRSWLRYTEKPLPHVSYLLDASGGRGINTPIDIFDDDPNIRVGYAGGMNTDNVGNKLRHLLDHRSYAEFWIDMESGVRDADDWLDLDKVEQVLKVCDPIIKEHERKMQR